MLRSITLWARPPSSSQPSLDPAATAPGLELVTSRSRPAARHDPGRGRYPVVGQSLGIQQPGVNDPPFVLPARLEIQQRRPCVLKFVKELQRVFSGGAAGIDRPRWNPAVPLLQNQDSCFALFHRRMFPATEAVGTEGGRAGQSENMMSAPPRASTPCRQIVAENG